MWTLIEKSIRSSVLKTARSGPRSKNADHVFANETLIRCIRNKAELTFSLFTADLKCASGPGYISNPVYRKYGVHNHKVPERTVTGEPFAELQRDRRTRCNVSTDGFARKTREGSKLREDIRRDNVEFISSSNLARRSTCIMTRYRIIPRDESR